MRWLHFAVTSAVHGDDVLTPRSTLTDGLSVITPNYSQLITARQIILTILWHQLCDYWRQRNYRTNSVCVKTQLITASQNTALITASKKYCKSEYIDYCQIVLILKGDKQNS